MMMADEIGVADALAWSFFENSTGGIEESILSRYAVLDILVSARRTATCSIGRLCIAVDYDDD